MSSTADITQLQVLIERECPLAHTVDVLVLGVPVHLESDSSDFIAAAQAAYPNAPAAHESSRAVIRLIVGPARADLANGDALFVPRLVHNHLLHLTGPHVQAYTDARVLQAGGIVAANALAHADKQTTLLDTLALFLVTSADRIPLHAAALRRGPVALLLAGRSGVGKSTLAYAARAAGIDVMSDDAVYVQRRPALRIWSLHRRLHVPASSAVYFPELEGLAPVQMTNGKLKLPIEPRSPRTVAHAEAAGICLLTRNGTGIFERISADEAAAVMGADLEPGFDRFADSIPDAVRRVAAGGAWRLDITGTPASTIPRIHELLRAVNPIS